MIHKAPADTPGKVRVTFELPSQFWAERINVVGDFNDWNKTATEMRQSGPEAAWQVTLELDTGREYQFRYLADGERWHNDSAADKYVPNEYGSSNSVVVT